MRIIATTFPLLALTAALVALNVPSAYAGGGCHRQGMTDGAGAEVRMTGNCFERTVLRVQPGDEVTWTNDDASAHTVTGAGLSFGAYDEIAGGGSVSYSFADAGVFPYFCVLHPSMVGAIVVGDGVTAGDSVTVAHLASPNENGSNATSFAAIAAAVGLGGAALGFLGTRFVGARKAGGES
jgi:plastocyanin